MKKIFILISNNIGRKITADEKDMFTFVASREYGELKVVFIGDGDTEADFEMCKNSYTEFFCSWASAISKGSKRQVEILYLVKPEDSELDKNCIDGLQLIKYHDQALKLVADQYGVDRKLLQAEVDLLAKIDGKIDFLMKESRSWSEIDKKDTSAVIGASTLKILLECKSLHPSFEKFQAIALTTLAKVAKLKEVEKELAKILLAKIASSTLEILKTETDEENALDVLAKIASSISEISSDKAISAEATTSIVDPSIVEKADDEFDGLPPLEKEGSAPGNTNSSGEAQVKEQLVGLVGAGECTDLEALI